MKRLLAPLSLLCSSLLLVFLAACASPPRESFYTLNAPALNRSEVAQHPASAKPLLVVTEVTMPEIVNRPQIVVHESANQVVLLEQQRWAAPLQSLFSLALAGHLQSKLPQWQLALRQQHANMAAPQQHRWTLWLDVNNFALQARQGVQLSAHWSIRNGEGKTVHSAQTSLQQACAACDNSALIAAQENLLKQLAQEIADVSLRLNAQ